MIDGILQEADSKMTKSVDFFSHELTAIRTGRANPALIEKVRTVVTDGEGLFKIVDLRPGTYSVTFTLPGFNTFKRDGIELSAGFTATVNAELRVGAVEETVTVSGQAPLVDVQNTRQQTVMNRDVMDTVPTARTGATISVLVPGVVAAGSASGTTAHDVGGSNGDKQPYLMVHGSKAIEMPRYYDGMRYSNMNGRAGGGCVIWTENNGTVEEYTVEVGSMSIDADVSGVRANFRIASRQSLRYSSSLIGVRAYPTSTNSSGSSFSRAIS